MSTVIKHLIPEILAHRPAVVFDYEHSAPVVAGTHVIHGDRPDELRMVRDAADGFILAVKSGLREGLCTVVSGNLLCTCRVGSDGKHNGPHVCATVQVVVHDIWIEEER